MPRRAIASQDAFIASLDADQRRWYLAETADREARLRQALDALCRGLGEVSGLHGEALDLRLRHPPGDTSPGKGRRRG